MIIIDINGRKRECINVDLDDKFPGYVKVVFKSKIRKGYKHAEWFPLNEFLEKNPELKKQLGKSKVSPPEDLGVVTKAGKKSLQDIAKNWKPNIYAGYPLWISRGKGEGQQRTVIKNNKNTLYIDKEWSVKPDKTSQYVLSRNVQENIKALGNELPSAKTKKVINDIIKNAKIIVD